MYLPRKYSYGPKLAVRLGCVVFFGALFLLNTYATLLASKHQDISTLGFFLLMEVLMGFMVLASVFTAVHHHRHPQELKLDNDAITFPDGFLQRRVVRIPYVQIQKVGEVEVVTRGGSHVLLKLSTRDGKYSVHASFLPDQETYEQVKDFMTSRVATRAA